MPQTFPYFRICRPYLNGQAVAMRNSYLLDSRYSNDRVSLVRSFSILTNDLSKLFDYVEPSTLNDNTFSHRIYELFLRACTEFEANCKAILVSNGYTKNSDFNITDYYKLNSVLKLNEYEVKFSNWNPDPFINTPFTEWDTINYTPLTWYKQYNLVKHDRNNNFELANLNNLMNAISGVFVILYAQFAEFAFEGFEQQMFFNKTAGFSSFLNSPFQIKPPVLWNNDEKYEFDWNVLSSNATPFAQYSF